MQRRAFVALSGAALIAFPRRARATGGIDIAGPSAQHVMRVLLASGQYAAPRQLDAWHFAWNERTYRGTFDTISLGAGRSGLVATVPLDAYLYGVLSREISATWPPAAQQAQAIVSRTYALNKLRPLKPYDIVASESDQQYGGIETETVEGRAAVDATGGVIVTFEDQPARVVFSACCGGRTADAGDVWNTPYPYLVGIADPNCAGTPAYQWQTELPVAAVESAFGSALSGIGALRSVALRVDDEASRPRSLDFVGRTSTFETTPNAFRAALGPGVVRSAFLHAAVLSKNVTSLALAGTGRGHGVGLCQWGARVLGDRGASAQDIIAFYFPGTAFGSG